MDCNGRRTRHTPRKLAVLALVLPLYQTAGLARGCAGNPILQTDIRYGQYQIVRENMKLPLCPQSPVSQTHHLKFVLPAASPPPTSAKVLLRFGLTSGFAMPNSRKSILCSVYNAFVNISAQWSEVVKWAKVQF